MYYINNKYFIVKRRTVSINKLLSNRKSLLVFLMLAVIGLSPTTNVLATTSNERNGCAGYTKRSYFNVRLRHKGQSFRGQGGLHIFEKNVNGHRRFCAIAEPAGSSALMMIKIGTRAQGNTKNSVHWDTTTRDYYDKGRVSNYIGGVAISPTHGRCAAVVAKMWKQGVVYKKKLTYNLCN